MQLHTRIRSATMRRFSSAAHLELLRRKARTLRKLKREPARVLYFHQVDDPYSLLAVQKLPQLRAQYNLPFEVQLVSKPGAAYQGSQAHFDHWALRDALSIAGDYGLKLSAPVSLAQPPNPAAVVDSNKALAACIEHDDFPEVALAIGESLYAGKRLPSTTGTDASVQSLVNQGDALRAKLGHYLGGMFYFDGEWYWSVDRLRLLEARLIDEGYGKGQPVAVTQPASAEFNQPSANQVTLEYFPSLRSPYTAVGHQRLLDLVRDSGVNLVLRPVMPMLMRGIPAPRAKQQYIIIDAGREARAFGVPFGNIVDPFGDPVKRAFALFTGAQALGNGVDFVTAYLAAAWAEGVDITAEPGLRQVAQAAGIGWPELQQAAAATPWEPILDANLTELLQINLWGVPSFRVSGGTKQDSYVCWGQDRIWRVAREIAQRV